MEAQEGQPDPNALLSAPYESEAANPDLSAGAPQGGGSSSKGGGSNAWVAGVVIGSVAAAVALIIFAILFVTARRRRVRWGRSAGGNLACGWWKGWRWC